MTLKDSIQSKLHAKSFEKSDGGKSFMCREGLSKSWKILEDESVSFFFSIFLIREAF